MKFAVIQTGGKQFIVKTGDKIQVEKLEGKAGDKVAFDNVLLVADGDKVEVGKPRVKGATVEGKVLKQARARKVLVMKYHNKTRYRRKKGHRQHFTEVEIVKI
ncbi:MAG: 50S ribosomal protein L21 [Candidatus Doudnabacteria bacterium CG10_big_fil_rev_8_21_14_0_10_41_10]|uniref:Large ribosomal subunit protein bL21 n=1 Tax=Candidatus Doudnabacteria bacterium CG10_big_fil_rev_8_21_14_0_10_41_10 TaxID=1974551 RepID=A0A2H0VDI9_9BACT|nr:MAG: 50S ribosomal protein L21 [Candidatus Doudnabacteria bacterium CG10_big_fil_rev_8_21_14_0_10_41_10]